jgi:hypothetical protein
MEEGKKKADDMEDRSTVVGCAAVLFLKEATEEYIRDFTVDGKYEGDPAVFAKYNMIMKYLHEQRMELMEKPELKPEQQPQE